MKSKNLFQELIDTKQLIEHDVGIYSLSGDFLDLVNYLDQKFQDLSKKKYAAKQEEYPSFLQVDDLKKIHFFEKLPCIPAAVQPIGNTNNIEELSLDYKYIFNPSTCYQTFLSHKGEKCRSELVTFTAKSRCFRNDKCDANPLRWKNFTMREIVFLGDIKIVRKMCDDFFSEYSKWLMNAGISAKIVTAYDVFYGKGAKILQKYQILNGVKKEFCLHITDLNNCQIELACMSRNYHHKLFVDNFNITSEDYDIESACVAIGLERLAYGVISQLGENALEILRR